MPTKEEALREILATFNKILDIEYKQFYGEMATHATRIVTSTPCKASDEIRNAFDHFSCAFDAVVKLSNDDVLPPEELSKLLDAALINGERGRRHIALAAFYWLREELRSQRTLILKLIKAAQPSKMMNCIQYKPEVTELDQETEELRLLGRRLPRDPIESKAQLEEAMQEILHVIDVAFKLTERHRLMYAKLESALR